MMTGLAQEQNPEKQIGCMSGFLNIFDRQHIFHGKRVYSKRLPPSTGGGESPKTAKSFSSPAVSREFEKPEPSKPVAVVPANPDHFQSSPSTNVNGLSIVTPPKSPLRLPMFQPEDGTPKSSWKFCKEMPRLSLDSRATIDSKGSLCPREIRADNYILSSSRTDCTKAIADGDDKQPRSPSVIARLMGLEQLPSSDSSSSPEAVKKPELRRSASESRVSRDLFHSRFVDGNNFHIRPNQPNTKSLEINMSKNNGVRKNLSNASNRNACNVRDIESIEPSKRNLKSESPWRLPQQKKNFFNSTDFFPEPKQTTASMNRDLEKRLKLRGIGEQPEDLERLKHILEALQLKGLLHSKGPSDGDRLRNFVYDRSFACNESKIVLMKPWRSPTPHVDHRSFGIESREVLDYSKESLFSVSPRLEHGAIDRSGRSPVRARNAASPTRTGSNVRISNSIVKRKPLSVETARGLHESSGSQRSSPANSPKLTTKRRGSYQQSTSNRSPANRKPVDLIKSKKSVKTLQAEDESSSISESTVSSSSQTDTERWKAEEYREGKSLLERCDKLLHSIAEMKSSTESQPSSAYVVPSPVSVLDSTFDKDESSPSPIMKRSIDFKDLAADQDDEIWSRSISPVKSREHKELISNDSDFIYISEVLRASQYLPEDSDVFLLVEKQQYLNVNHTSNVSRLQRKLVFDIIVEILDRNRQLQPWKVVPFTDSDSSLKQIWSEFQKIRKRETTDDLLELICGILKKDLAGITSWEDHPVEISEAVLEIERLMFKDLVSETIRDLAESAGKSTFLALRRKLVF